MCFVHMTHRLGRSLSYLGRSVGCQAEKKRANQLYVAVMVSAVSLELNLIVYAPSAVLESLLSYC